MKKLKLYFILLFGCQIGFSQTGTLEILSDTYPTYEGVITYEGISKSELHSMIMAWIALTYNSAQDVIQLNDPEAGKIITKGLSKCLVNQSSMGIKLAARFPVSHTLVINIKRNRFKYQMTFDMASEGFPSIYVSDPPTNLRGKPLKGLMLRNVIRVKSQLTDCVVSFVDSISKELCLLEASTDDW